MAGLQAKQEKCLEQERDASGAADKKCGKTWLYKLCTHELIALFKPFEVLGSKRLAGDEKQHLDSVRGGVQVLLTASHLLLSYNVLFTNKSSESDGLLMSTQTRSRLQWIEFNTTEL